MALMKPGDTFLGLDLAAGGHLTHGAAGQHVGQVVQRRCAYSVRQDDQRIDMDEVARARRASTSRS